MGRIRRKKEKLKISTQKHSRIKYLPRTKNKEHRDYRPYLFYTEGLKDDVPN